MRLRDQLLTEFDLEAPFTRDHLARVPDDRLDWTPHERSMPIGVLAGFLSISCEWGTLIVERESFDPVAAYGDTPPSLPASTAAMLDAFDRTAGEMRRAIAGASEERLVQPWTLLAAGAPMFTQPRWLLLRTYVLNHMVHHRAQLGVYLRLLGAPVPAVYNDSADERGGMFLGGA